MTGHLLATSATISCGDPVTEERKHAILFAATLLSARKIIDALDSSKPNPGKDFFIDKALKEASAILEKIDQRWPAEDVREKVR